MQIPIKSISIGPRLRKARTSKVSELAASMKQLGLLQPIGVTRRKGWGLRYELSYGLHRLLAAKELGWREIECTVLDGKLSSKGQIVENTHRADLSALERAEHTAELYRMAKADGTGERKNWGRGRPATTSDVVNAMPLSGSSQARKKRVQRARKVAKLPKEVKRAAKRAKLDNNLATLIKIADLPDVRSQLNFINGLSQAEKPKQRAPRGVVQLAEEDKASLRNLRNRWRTERFRKSLQKATPVAQRVFIRDLLKTVPSGLGEG